MVKSKKQIIELSRPECRMEQQNITDPLEALEVFFNDFPLAATRKNLWELYQGWVMSERAVNCDPKMPANLLFFYTHLEMLAEAVLLLKQYPERKPQ